MARLIEETCRGVEDDVEHQRVLDAERHVELDYRVVRVWVPVEAGFVARE